MSLFPPNNILEEEIFTPRNLGPDCDLIGGLLERFGEKFILSALEDGASYPDGHDDCGGALSPAAEFAHCALHLG